MTQIKKTHVAPDVILADWQASLGDQAQAIPQLMATDALQNCFGSEYVEC